MALKFGTSGVRGLVTEMTDRECALYTLAFLDYCRHQDTRRTVVVGGDLRSSTPRILAAICDAVGRWGGSVVFAGYVPTPAVVYSAMGQGFPSIMVTGSHIPDDRNGIKFNLPWGEVLKPDEQWISQRLAQAEAGELLPGFDPDAYGPDGFLKAPYPLPEQAPAVMDAYRDRYLTYFPDSCLSGLKIVVYQHSTVGRELLTELLTDLGAKVITVGRSEHFIPVDTEAVQDQEQLAAWVSEHEADALVSADGDCDRPLVIDANGQIVRGDVLGILVAKYLSADAVAVPVSCNSALELAGLADDIRRCRIGSPYVIESMNDARKSGRNLVVGYEANGGFLLASEVDGLAALPTRDAVLPIIALLHASQQANVSISDLVQALPSRYTWSGLLRETPTHLSQKLVSRLVTDRELIAAPLFGDVAVNIAHWDLTDGVRMTLDDGSIFHLRPSGNAPEFRIYTEASSMAEAANLGKHIDISLRAAFALQSSCDRWLPADAQRLANIATMNAAPANNQGMNILIISVTSLPDAHYWQARLEATRGQVSNTDALILVVHEDWPSGAGNGLGTLYALQLAERKARASNPDFDLMSELAAGAAVGVYHTAGKGTRMAPLPACEQNNKPAVCLPGLVDIDGVPTPITVLEAAIKQTGPYAQSRRGRLSVFWGDQVFVPSQDTRYEPRHHIDLLGQLGPMPDAESWEERGLSGYGLLAMDEEGNAVQVDKITYPEAVRLAHNGEIQVSGGVAISIGSFSLSTPMLLALMDEFAHDLEAKSARYDSDPHFWMPMTLELATYTAIMSTKGTPQETAKRHHARMQAVAKRLLANHTDQGLLGIADAGLNSYWWDYGQLAVYHANMLLLCHQSREAEAARLFFGVSGRRQQCQLGPAVDIDEESCIIGGHIGSGVIRKSILVDVRADRVDATDAVLVSCTAPELKGQDCIGYRLSRQEPTTIPTGQVMVDVPNQNISMQTRVADASGEDWDLTLPGNPMSYADLYTHIQAASK